MQRNHISSTHLPLPGNPKATFHGGRISTYTQRHIFPSWSQAVNAHRHCSMKDVFKRLDLLLYSVWFYCFPCTLSLSLFCLQPYSALVLTFLRQSVAEIGKPPPSRETENTKRSTTCSSTCARNALPDGTTTGTCLYGLYYGPPHTIIPRTNNTRECG